ncbi:MAG: GNAT family N-acetyltransferase [Deltaproteobacteria bacterium]|jgi:RimJ/RimL family protein N-acetyltransferase|nr:GNAT family N-acetyltransferase [Deltaproteobacteria bacterium]MBW2529846.1 GNAT family N-acetyltransferase [Deltaproteobacteria bacterium]
MELHTPRLRLVAQTARLARLESSLDALAGALDAEVPTSWPPEEMSAAIGSWTEELSATPKLVGWVNWYWLARADPRQVLIGYGGFKGMPDGDGNVELGYAVLEEHQRRGYAFEALSELIRWAHADRRVRRIAAEARVELIPSIRLLEKLGFRRLPRTDPEVLRYALDRSTDS